MRYIIFACTLFVSLYAAAQKETPPPSVDSAQYALGLRVVDSYSYKREPITREDSLALTTQQIELFKELADIEEALFATVTTEEYESIAIKLTSIVDRGYSDELLWYHLGIAYYYSDQFSSAIWALTQCINEVGETGNRNFFKRDRGYSKINGVYREYFSFSFRYASPSDAYKFRGLSKVKMDDYRGAVPDFSEAIKAEDEFICRHWRGYSYIMLEQPEKALPDIEMALSMKSDHGKTMFLKGACYLALSDKENACIAFSKAGEMGYVRAYEAIKEKCN